MRPEAQVIDDENLLLEVLNTSPVVDGWPQDRLVGDDGAQIVRMLGGTGSPDELAHTRSARDALQRVIRGDEAAMTALSELVTDVALVPVLTAEGIRWELTAPAEKQFAARVLLAWSHVRRERPGRLRACANADCNLYLIDRSRPGTAKWCSMATCGNRMKARAHAQRARLPEAARRRAGTRLGTTPGIRTPREGEPR